MFGLIKRRSRRSRITLIGLLAFLDANSCQCPEPLMLAGLCLGAGRDWPAKLTCRRSGQSTKLFEGLAGARIEQSKIAPSRSSSLWPVWVFWSSPITTKETGWKWIWTSWSEIYRKTNWQVWFMKKMAKARNLTCRNRQAHSRLPATTPSSFHLNFWMNDPMEKHETVGRWKTVRDEK